MTLEAMTKFIDAAKSAGIKHWVAITDVGPGNYYNSDNAFNVIDKDNETLLNFRKSIHIDYCGSGKILVQSADLADIHEVKIAADKESIDQFIKAYGLSLDDEQAKILINLKANNNYVKPVEKDYLKFEKLSDEEVASLTDEQRAEYEAQLKLHEEKTAMSRPGNVYC